MRKPIAASLLAGSLVLAGLGAVPQQAEAATPWIDICVDPNSRGFVQPSLDGVWGTIWPGGCVRWDNPGGRLRVQVYNQSYRRSDRRGQPYGSCLNSPASSNPPDASNYGRVTYKSYGQDGCRN